MDNDYELVFLAQEKDEIASEILYKKYSPLINKKIKSYFRLLKNMGFEYDDVKQEVIIGFEIAINNYDQNSEASFFTFVNVCIDRHLRKILIKYNREKYKILNDAVCYDIEDYSLLDVIGEENTPETYLFDEDGLNNLYNKIDFNLTFYESIIFKLKIDGYEYKEMSDILDIDVKNVYNYIRRIKSKIKNVCNV